MKVSSVELFEKGDTIILLITIKTSKNRTYIVKFLDSSMIYVGLMVFNDEYLFFEILYSVNLFW